MNPPNATTTVTLNASELRNARSIVLAVDPSENDSDNGIVLICRDGVRTWTAWSDDSIASTDPVTADVTDGLEWYELVVPRRLVEFAAGLADEHTVLLTAGPEALTLSTADIMIGFDAPADRPIPAGAISLCDLEGSRADIGAASLRQLFEMARVLPCGVDLSVIDAPAFRLYIDANSIYGSVDWSAAGTVATTWSIPVLSTVGVPGAAQISPSMAAHVLSLTDPEAVAALTIPELCGWIEISVPGWTVRLLAWPDDEEFDYEQLPFIDTIRVEGGLRRDPLEGADLTDVRALAIDIDVMSRITAAASRWNWDVRVQQALAADPDERVVLALLDHVDPDVEVSRSIIAGPHVAARQNLARRNLRTELLELLAEDADPTTSEAATRTLARAARDVVLAEASLS